MSLNEISEGIYSSGTLGTEAPNTKITKFKFKKRMTPAERMAIRLAGETDAVIFDFMDLLAESEYVDLTDSDVIDGLNYIQSKGHLTAERVTVILTTPASPDELY